MRIKRLFLSIAPLFAKEIAGKEGSWKMKCRVCGTEIGEQVYCPMCGASVNPQQETKTEQQGQIGAEYSYQYQGIDADATIVLSANSINEKEEKENSGEERCVVLGEVEVPRKSHKKLILVLSIAAVVMLITGIGIFCYLHYIYPNKITYMHKSIYFESKENMENSEGLKLDVSSKNSDARSLIGADYNKNIFLYAGTDGKSLEWIAEEGNVEVSEDRKIVSVIADDAISKVYYWTQEEENMYSLHCLGEEDTLKRYVTGVNGTVISQNGEYLAYSYRAEENAYVVCEVMPSGEVNQIVTLENPSRVLGVTNDGKVFCQQQNPSTGKTEEGEESESTYSIYCIQDKKNYGSDLSEVVYFGYYNNLESFVIQTADKSVYYMDTREEGTQRLIATNVDWFSDVSEPCKYQQVCDREVILGISKPKTLENTTPCYYYLKENSLYSYDILQDNESQKVAGNFGRAQNIEMWNQSLIFYLAGETLYSCEKTEEGWQEPKLLAKKCADYQYAPEQECIYYLADGTLYSYKDGKEEKISDKVKSFDLNQEEGLLAYSTDTSLVICKKDEEEYALKANGQIFVIGQDVYYKDTKNTLYRLSGETGETEKEADEIEAIKYIWK